MSCLVQIDFKYNGPFDEDMVTGFSDIAKSINEEPGFIMKIWTENAKTLEAGGIYLFDTEKNAKQYLAMHIERLSSFGIVDVNSKIFQVNEKLSQLNHMPILK